MGNQGNQPSSLTPSMLADIVNSTVQKVKEGKVFAASLRNELELYEYEQPDENSEEFSVLQLLYDGFSKNKNTEKFYGSYYAQIPLKSTSFFKELSRNAATLLSIKVADNMVAHCKRVSNASTVSSSLPSKTVLCEKEKAGLQYLGGYVLHNLHKKCTRMDTTESQQAMAILKAGRLENNFESQKLVSSLSRGGLWAITENAQKVFTRTEHYFRLSAAADGAHKVDISGITNQASRDSEVISYYQNMVSDAETVPASHTSKDMLHSIISMYVKVRSFSLAKDIVSAHKIKVKQPKAKALRKEIKRSSGEARQS